MAVRCRRKTMHGRGEVFPLIWKYLVIAAGSYVVGSLSLSILASKALFGSDIRKEGSGNAGATNMARVHGWGAGLLTLAWDALKAAACMFGGSIAVGGAVAFGIDWRVGVATVGSFLLGSLLSKKVSVGSLCGAIAIAASSFLFHVSTPRLILSIFCACLAIARHHANIKRLAEGTEPDFKAGKSGR